MIYFWSKIIPKKLIDSCNYCHKFIEKAILLGNYYKKC